MLPVEQQIVTRHIINPDMILRQHNADRSECIEFNYEEFCGLINFWKILLVEKYHAQPGKKVMIEFLQLNAYYYAAIFASFELGLILIVDWPHARCEEDTRSHRMTMHGRIDYAIVNHGMTTPGHKFFDHWDYLRTANNCDVIITDKEFDEYKIQDPELYNRIATTIYAKPELDALWSASGGTTGLAKQTRTTHRQTYLQAERLIKPLGFTNTDSSLHVRNLHHGASLVYHWLPSWMVAKHHSILAYTDISELCPVIKEEKITKVQLYTQQMVLDYLRLTEPLEHKLDIVTLFNTTDKAVDLIKEKNINSVRIVFGDTTIGLGFFVKTVDQTTTKESFKRGCVGAKLDDFFDFKIEDGLLHIAIPVLGQDWRTSGDRFDLVDGLYYFYGRSNRYRIGNEWVVLGDLDLKVDQLFGSGATIVIDDYHEQIYLSIWKDNPAAEEELKNYFKETYNNVSINKIAKNLDIDNFMVSRKVDRQQLKQYFQKLN